MDTFFWDHLSIASFVVSMLMIAVWFLGKRLNNFSIVDPAWCFSFTILAVLFAAKGDAWINRKLMMLVMVAFWSCRLGWYLLKRHGAHEDNRYRALRASYGKNYVLRFFVFYQYQAISVVLLTVPFLEISLNESPRFTIAEYVGFFVWLAGYAGESIADRQLSEFKKNPANKGEVCDVGLWRYSRHPNYFFESVIWWGYFIFTLGTPGTIYTVYCPLVILLLLLKFTGVPLAEKQSLESRGDKYRNYQRQVSVFVPWFRKSN